MAGSSLRAPALIRRKRRRAALLLVLILAGVPASAYAALSVVDSAAIAKITAMVNKATEQIAKLVEIKDKVQEQIDAIGELGTIILPTVDLKKLERQFRSDLNCLTLNLDDLFGIEFKELTFKSICEQAKTYEQALTLQPPADGDPEETLRRRLLKLEEVQRRRERVVRDASLKGLATADAGLRSAEAMGEAAGELQSAGAKAETAQDRLAVLGQAQAATLRGLAKTNELLSQLLRVQSGFTLWATGDVEAPPPEGLPAGDGRKPAVGTP